MASIENQQQLNFGEIKNIKYKKILLSKYIEDINKNNENINIQKNNLILKTLFTKLKDINENNIIIKNGKINEIHGIIIKNGLLILTNELYKNKKESNFSLKFKK